jgi:hypothetical protein
MAATGVSVLPRAPLSGHDHMIASYLKRHTTFRPRLSTISFFFFWLCFCYGKNRSLSYNIVYRPQALTC